MDYKKRVLEGIDDISTSSPPATVRLWLQSVLLDDEFQKLKFGPIDGASLLACRVCFQFLQI